MSFCRTSCVLAVLLGGLGSAGWADTYGTARIAYQSSYGGVAGFSADYNYDGTVDRLFNNNVYTGEYQFAFDAANSTGQAATLLTNPFGAFCIDVTQYASSAWNTYTIVDLEDAPSSTAVGAMTPAKANDVRELFGRIMHSAWDSANPGQGGYIGGGVISAEAFAACLWEIVFEKPGVAYDLSSGYFKMNGMDWGADAVAQAWLDRLTQDASWRDQHVLALISPDHQDFALTSSSFGDNGVPEPLTLLAVGSGVAGIGAYIRKRRLA